MVKTDKKTYAKLVKMAEKMKVKPLDLLEFLCEIGIPHGWNVKILKKKK